MTDRELLSKLQEIKKITPTKEWVALSKMNILGAQKVSPSIATKSSFTHRFSSVVATINMVNYRNRLAYSFAVFLFIFAGLVGVMKFGFPELNSVKSSQESVASLAAESALRTQVAEFKQKSQVLAEVSKDASQSQTISSAVKQANDATKNLTQAIAKNPQLAKTVALDVNNASTNVVNNSALLDIPGGSALKSTSDDLYKTIDNQMINDLEKTTLTQDQKNALNDIKKLYDKGNYSSALVNILLIGNTGAKK